MKLSLIQMNSQSDKQANIAAAKDLMERAIAEEHLDLLVLPKMFDLVGGETADKLRAAESIPGGPAYAMCQEVARAHAVFVHAGSLIADPWGHVIAKASDGIGSVTARIDPERITKVRRDMPLTHHKALEV